LQQRLQAAGVAYLPWSDRALPAGLSLAEGEIVGRFVMSFETTAEAVEQLIGVFAAPRG
jgi:threonine aldolase